MRLVAAALLVLAIAPVAEAGGGPSTPGSSRTFHYTCGGGQKISATYATFGPGGPTSVVLNWRGREYGLAEALSASGARYASRAGPEGARSGLEWWEHQGEATLSTFVGTNTGRTRALLTGCRTGR
ncbi:membrane-bound inhibitor of C-type lysozyme [Deinococcus sp. HSC-46F16]|uniref:MliC family protein n=1 Tax=Deinococcus sp. HSC-46F16 TaxID=2910968 RepID=UPI00209CB8CD|nr:MliC family protein [Deinococcus sp. HSC-46F16]MCP2013184.1 membrane-bound inhibitor of C-type lysozyme [Deinococcus sp. HSC-46F16]